MATEYQHIKGFAELDKLLGGLEPRVRKNVARGGLRAGAVEMRKVTRRNTPVGAANAENVRLYGGYEGALRDSVRVVTREVPGELQAAVMIGGKSPKTDADVFYAHLVEWGTAAHLIKPSVAKVLHPTDDGAGFSADNLFFGSAHHPGTHATYFATRSMEEGKGAFLKGVQTYITKRLVKEFAKEKA